jgi:L-histidine N-alpha-methyltransferase
MDVEFADGEELLTEISCKFTRAGVTETCAAAGLRVLEWHEDRDGRFALTLATRPEPG